MSEKIAVHCPTKEWRGKLSCSNFSEGYWARNCYMRIDNKVWYTKLQVEEKGYTIITAADYLKEEEVEFKVGDRVECVDDDEGRFEHVKKGEMYTIDQMTGGDIWLGSAFYTTKRFKLATKQTKPAKEAVSMEEVDADDLCNFCEGHYENMSRDRCEGCRCQEAYEMYIEENPNEQESNMKINSTIRKVFKGENFELVEAMQENFGDEIAETFTGEINLDRDKLLYVAEIKRLEEEAKEEAESCKAAK